VLDLFSKKLKKYFTFGSARFIMFTQEQIELLKTLICKYTENQKLMSSGVDRVRIELYKLQEWELLDAYVNFAIAGQLGGPKARYEQPKPIFEKMKSLVQDEELARLQAVMDSKRVLATEIQAKFILTGK
jgi:hypothetical protein